MDQTERSELSIAEKSLSEDRAKAMKDLRALGFRTFRVADGQLLVRKAESLDDCCIHFAFPEGTRRLVENLQNREEEGAVGGDRGRRHDSHTTGEVATALGVAVARCRDLIHRPLATWVERIEPFDGTVPLTPSDCSGYPPCGSCAIVRQAIVKVQVDACVSTQTCANLRQRPCACLRENGVVGEPNSSVHG